MTSSAAHPDDAYDVVVIGGGTGGYATALRAAGLGLTTVLVERGDLGGTCLHRGCILSKALLHAAELRDGITEAGERWGINAVVQSVDAAALAAARDDVVAKSHRGLVGHLAKAGVLTLAGEGRLTGPRGVRVQQHNGIERQLTARRGIVLATGSRPRLLPGLPVDGRHVVTSDEALLLDTLPESVVILGAGAIGVEYASFYRSMGAAVTVVEFADRIVPLEDEDVSRHLARGLRKRGITLLTGTRLEGAEVHGGAVRATARGPRGEPHTLDAAMLLVAVGREPVTDGLGLETVGLAPDVRGHVPPADWSRLETDVPGVHVVGDLLPPPSLALAHASFAEGLLVAEALAGRATAPTDYAGVPRATYSSPQAAGVGLTERQARERAGDPDAVVVNTLPLSAVAKGLIHGQGGMAKMVAERDGAVLGVHLVGPHVTELLAEAELIVNWEAEPGDVARLVHPHPTLSEAVGEAFLTLGGRALHQH